ncbi:MAG: LacI family DNA-binding transcriptional regulator [Terrimicrobiaceae bacterium]|nr:LacI family DNA-binding transcriptional regulator [Terrimicrobiaceae bacterium]
MTQSDLARMAGVSPATVSLALRNSPEVSLKTCRRIQTLAKRCGYVPNASAANLAAARWAGEEVPFRGVLAFGSGDSGGADVWKQWATHRKMFEGARARARETGYEIEEFWWHDPALRGRRLSRVLAARGIPGVIWQLVDGVRGADFERMGFGGLAMSVVGVRYLEAPLHSATNDQFGSSALAASRLREAGCRRIGMILDERIDWLLDRRFAGGYLTHGGADLPGGAIPVFTDIQNGPRAADWIERHEIDGVLCIPYPFHHHLQSAGIRIPEDVAFAYLDVHEGEPAFGGCAGVDQLHGLVGAAAVDLVTSQIHRRECGVPACQRVLLTEGKWCPGWSVSERSARSEESSLSTRSIARVSPVE